MSASYPTSTSPSDYSLRDEIDSTSLPSAYSLGEELSIVQILLALWQSEHTPIILTDNLKE